VDARSKSGPFAALLAKLRQLWQRPAKCNPAHQSTEVSSKANPRLPPTKEQHMAFAKKVRKAFLSVPPPPGMSNNPADPSSAPAKVWRRGFEDELRKRILTGTPVPEDMSPLSKKERRDAQADALVKAALQAVGQPEDESAVPLPEDKSSLPTERLGMPSSLPPKQREFSDALAKALTQTSQAADLSNNPAPQNPPLTVQEFASLLHAAAAISESKRLARDAIARAAAR
jgi:hypothetical protein